MKPGAGRLALGGVMLGWLAFIWAWEPAYLTLTVDDSFYYFQIARNLGHGLGSTFDGIHATNGYHPLWLLLVTPIASLPGDDVPVRLALSAQILLVYGGIRILVWQFRDSLPVLEGVVAFAMLSFYTMKTMVNGTESALQFFLLCAATAMSARRSSYALGIVAALVVFSRFDAIVFASVLVMLPVFWPIAERRGRDTVRACIGLFVPVTLMLLANWIWFGHPLSVSGAIKGEWAWQTITAGSIALAIAFALVTILGYRMLALRTFAETQRLVRLLFPLFAYAVFIIAMHGVAPKRLVFEIWYLPPVVLVALLAAAKLTSWAWSGAAPKKIALTTIAIGYAAAMAIGWSHRMRPSSYIAYEAARRSGHWVRDHVPDEAKVAGWDCGIAAWHSGRGVIQLEGLVNSWEFKRNVLSRGRTAEYLDEAKITHLVQPIKAYFLAPTIPTFEGVSLDDWFIEHAECVNVSELNGTGTRDIRLYSVLARNGNRSTVGDVKKEGLESFCRRNP